MRTPCTDVRTLLTETTEPRPGSWNPSPNGLLSRHASAGRRAVTLRVAGVGDRGPGSTRDADRHRPHGAPEITVVAGGQVYATLFKALGRLVLGHDRAVLVPAEAIDE